MGERERALTYVRGLYARYVAGVKSGRLPRFAETFYRERVHHLGRDIEVMQAEGDDGLAVARGWCRVAGC